jgi:hypothetical protein
MVIMRIIPTTDTAGITARAEAAMAAGFSTTASFACSSSR